MTAVEWLVKELEINPGIRKWVADAIEKARQMERKIIEDAMMYSLDEDGHTGDWKQKFIKKYIDDLSNHSRDNESV